jgi:hypothetical protein
MEMPAISGRWRKSLASIGAQASSQSPGIWEFGGLTTFGAVWVSRAALAFPPPCSGHLTHREHLLRPQVYCDAPCGAGSVFLSPSRSCRGPSCSSRCQIGWNDRPRSDCKGARNSRHGPVRLGVPILRFPRPLSHLMARSLTASPAGRDRESTDPPSRYSMAPRRYAGWRHARRGSSVRDGCSRKSRSSRRR